MGGNHRIQNIFKFFFSLLFWLRQSKIAYDSSCLSAPLCHTVLVLIKSCARGKHHAKAALAWSKWNLKRDSMIYVVMKFGLARMLVFLLQRKLEGVHPKILWLDPHKTLIVELWLQSLLVLTLTWMRPNMLY
ncbi:hypothetical protein CMV_016768 [Castanea mollissima]|uniref:Uncharacterized protein n=1 Tax=Castanea mollissima TaxID=60419 RepID=A0A8J4VRF4_9ROSI|nr:hypothetical protein CMV_016768 [Castanea mollissima]